MTFKSTQELVHDMPRLFHRVLQSIGIVPGAALLVTVFMIPIAFMLWKSVSEPVLGLGHYQQILTNPTALYIILRTLKVSFAVATVTVLLSYPYAYLMTVVPSGTRYLMTLVVLIPFWTSLMARTFAWLVLLQTGGPLDSLFRFLHLGSFDLLGTSTAVTIGMAQTLMPFAVFPLYSTMRNIDRNLLFAAQSLGAPLHVAFLRIYLPLSEPGIVVSWFMVFVLSLGFYVTPQLLGSTHNALLSQYIAIKISKQLQFGTGSALAVTLLISTLILLGLIGLMRKRSRAMTVTDL